ncbi:hypothetical protein DI272_29425 [Streptomyces sp. Act143]|uniref:hypothetical protein n=1 Tax=Streptomyces sp. Act143 TaxID=2200760 RepID=UPI000D67FC23|nr:hypothetical protein [Streptomyces sp. Act143]PWI17822.1 hypothetical protein DI272_29425 [Streptomyces sp. Act143]
MTAYPLPAAPAVLVEDVARIVENVPGVAFLKPGLAARLRSALSRPHPDAGRAPTAGVRLTPEPDATIGWHVDVQVVTVRRARAVDVARAVRSAVEEHLAARCPGRPGPRVTVTVTGQV